MNLREFKLLIDKDGMITFTPELANRILSENNYSNQRKLETKRCREYAVLMMDGEWDFTHPIDFSGCDNIPNLMNGQHRLTAIAYTGMTFKQSVYLKSAADEKELANQYSKYDRGGMRGPRDAFRATNAFEDAIYYGKAGIEASHTRATTLIDIGFNYGSFNHSRRYYSDSKAEEIIKKHIPISNDYFRIIGIRKPSHSPLRFLWLPSIMALGYLILGGDAPQEAYSFINGIRENDGLRKHDPRKVLIEWFGRDNIKNKIDALTNIKSHNAFTRCWNAYVRDENVKMLRSVERPLLPLLTTNFKEIDKSTFYTEKIFVNKEA